MHNEILIAVVAGLTSMVGWGTADFFAKKTIDRIGDVTTLFWAQLLGVIPLVVLFAVHPKVPHLAGYDPLFILLFGMVSALSYIPLYNGFGKGKVSLLSPIFASYSVVVVILAAIFLLATVSAHQAVAISLVFIGILLISVDPTELRTLATLKKGQTKGVPEVLSAMLVYSFWLLLFDKFINGKAWVFYLLSIRTISVITLFTYSTVRKQSMVVHEKGLGKYLVGIGFFDVLAFAAVSYGYSHTSYIAIVTVLSATFSLPTIFLAFLFLKERVTKLQLLAAIVILSGVVLISL